MDNKNILFEETQRFSQGWIKALFILYAINLTYLTFMQFFFKIPFLGLGWSNTVVGILWFIFGILTPVIFMKAKLITQVKPDGVYIKFFPVHQSPLKLDTDIIKSARIKNYSALKDFGGWGIRYGKDGNAFNVSGNEGVNIELTTSRDILIGSQRSEELFNAIQKILIQKEKQD